MPRARIILSLLIVVGLCLVPAVPAGAHDWMCKVKTPVVPMKYQDAAGQTHITASGTVDCTDGPGPSKDPTKWLQLETCIEYRVELTLWKIFTCDVQTNMYTPNSAFAKPDAVCTYPGYMYRATSAAKGTHGTTDWSPGKKRSMAVWIACPVPDPDLGLPPLDSHVATEAASSDDEELYDQLTTQLGAAGDPADEAASAVTGDRTILVLDTE